MSYPTYATADELITFMAPKGADLLVKGLKHRVYESDEPIIHSEASILEITDNKGIAHAPKITPNHRQIESWADLDAASLLRKDQALGKLWDTTTYDLWAHQCRQDFPKSEGKGQPIRPKRVIFSGGFEEFKQPAFTESTEYFEDLKHVHSILSTDPPPGQLIFLPRKRWLPKELLIVTSDKKILRVKSCTLEGGKKEDGAKELYSVLISDREAYGRLQKRLRNKGVTKKELMQRAKDRKAAASAMEETSQRIIDEDSEQAKSV
jgi:hypothetical protein